MTTHSTLGAVRPCPLCGHRDIQPHPDGCEACDERAQLGLYAPCQTVAQRDRVVWAEGSDPETTVLDFLNGAPPYDAIPPGATVDDDREELAAELEAEYAAAVDRIRDRAQEARAGGRYMRRHKAPVGPHDLAELVRRNRIHARIQLASRQADEMLGVPLRHTPIGAAGLAASAAQQTGGNR